MKIKFVHDQYMNITHLSECEKNKDYYCINPECHGKIAIKNGANRILHPSHIKEPCEFTDSEALLYVCKKIIMEHVLSHKKGYKPPTFTIPKYNIIRTAVSSRLSDNVSDNLLEATDLQQKYFSECDLAINIYHQPHNIYRTFTVYIKFSLDSEEKEYHLDKSLGHHILEININDQYIYDMKKDDLKYILIDDSGEKEWKHIPTSKDKFTKHKLLESRIAVHRNRTAYVIEDCPLIPPDNSFDIKQCLHCPCLQERKKTYIVCSAAWGIFDSKSFYDRICEVDNFEYNEESLP